VRYCLKYLLIIIAFSLKYVNRGKGLNIIYAGSSPGAEALDNNSAGCLVDVDSLPAEHYVLLVVLVDDAAPPASY